VKRRVKMGSVSPFISVFAASLVLGLGQVRPALANDIAPPTEVQARHLDEDALQAKRIALKSFSGIVPRYHGTPQEPVFLLREAEMIQDIAAIEYRLIFGKDSQASKITDKADKKIDLSVYQKTMRDSLVPLNQIIATAPRFQKLPHTIRMRAKAYQELGYLEEALRDLKYFVATWPAHAEAPLAYSDLWAMLIQKKYYEEAIQYINRYGLRVNDKYYHAALDNLAWCHYFLGSVSLSLDYTETALKTSKGMERDKAVSNLALFYATGVEKKDPTTPSDQALARFKKSVSGDDLEKVSISYAYLLRSKALDEALEQYKNQAYLDPALPNTGRSDLLILTSENELNRQKYTQMKISIDQELDLIRKVPAMKKNAKVMAKAKASLSSSAQALQKTLALPNQAMNPEVASILGVCYQFLIDVSQGNVLEQGRLHYNIGESALIAKDMDGATRNYRWIVDNLSIKAPDQKDLYIQASVKALEVRYQMIQDKGWRPNELTAKSIDSTPKELPTQVKEWITWVDRFPVEAASAKVILDLKYDTLLFESNRILYAYDDVAKSVQRLLAFVDKYPTSKSAIPSAALVIDTYVTSKKWNDAYITAGKFASIDAWKGTDFSKSLGIVIGDSYYSILNSSYMAKDYAGTLKSADDFVHKNPGNRRQADFLELAANSSLGLGDKVKASGYFKQLAQMGGEKKEVVALSLMTDGSIAEDRFDFGAASDSYRKLLEAGGQADPTDLRKKVLLFAWLSGDQNRLNSAMASKLVCPTKADPTCKEYQERKTPTSSVAVALNRLKILKKLSFKHRSETIEEISHDWSHQSAIDQQALLGELSDVIPKILHDLRLDTQKNAHVDLDQWAIQHRVKLIKEFEAVSEKVAALPLIRFQVLAQLEVAGTYQDMIQDLHAIKRPRGVSDDDAKEIEKLLASAAEPFVKKRDDLKLAALTRVQETGIDAQTVDMFFSTFKNDSKSDSKDDASLNDIRTGKEQSEQDYAFDGGLLAGITPPPTDGGKALVSAFQSLLQQSNRQQAGFMIQMATEQKLLSDSNISLMKAVLLAKSGLIAEATSELRAHFAVFDSKAKDKAGAAIWTAYASLGANEVVAKDLDSGGKLVAIGQKNLPAPVAVTSPVPAGAPAASDDKKKGPAPAAIPAVIDEKTDEKKGTP
jgi:tetratricopeptide (TPR) repeat protein